VPFTIKNSIETAGLRTTSRFPPLADYVPATDAPVVAWLRAAGAILMGKTNVPTLTGDAQTDNPLFRPLQQSLEPDAHARWLHGPRGGGRGGGLEPARTRPRH